MRTISRRLFLRGAATFGFAAAGLSSYAFAIEPAFRLDVTPYHLAPPLWPEDLILKVAVLADVHACEPWMPASRIRGIAELTNSLKPDIIFLLGDFSGGHRYVTGPVMPADWGAALSALDAPLGVYAVLGNHDWWHGPLPGMPADGARGVRRALHAAGIEVLENRALRLQKDGRRFWVAGLGDQLAEVTGPRSFHGRDDLAGTLAQVKDDAPVVLLAHEPAIFPHVSSRVALTLCGHTHGGQINLPLLREYFAARYAGGGPLYGHVFERGRNLIISGGLGTSIAPVRFLRPPEVVEILIGGASAPSQS